MRFPTHLLLSTVLAAALTADGSAAPQPSTTRSAIDAAPAASPELRVYLINEAGVTRPALEVAEAEAGAIWATVGLHLTWTSPPVPFVLGDGVTAIVRRAIPAPAPGAADRHVCSHPELGHLLFDEDGQAGNLIEVSFEAVTSLVMHGSYMDRPIPQLPDFARDRVLGLALGRVVAHEVGHWVMGRGHTGDGLMKPSFTARDVLQSHTAQLPRAWTAAGSELRLLLSSGCELVASHRGARSAARPLEQVDPPGERQYDAARHDPSGDPSAAHRDGLHAPVDRGRSR
jgi:hypothetical protein